jgi:uncharacterized YigZ family protein
MANGYPVPSGPAQIELSFRNSRFIGVAGPAATADEAKAFIAIIRKRFADASHHVYAFAAGYGASVVHGMSDDGEPSGTAGRPALAVVKGAGLGDVVVVLVRYFGGTKLGTGGLVKAYTATTQAVLAALVCHEKFQATAVRVVLPYELLQQGKGFLENEKAVINAETFGTQVMIDATVRQERVEALAQAFQQLSAGRVELERLDAAEES